MSRYAIGLAGPGDDAALRARMARDVMEGAIAVSFRREPSYFAGCRLQGDLTQVVKCVDRATGELVGMGSRSTGLAHVDGAPARIGYLADLRLDRKRRRGTLLARGYRYFRQLHRADPVPFYTTVIYEGNATAAGVLVGGRAQLPLYRDWGRLLTPAIRLDGRVRCAAASRVRVERGARARTAEISDFLNRVWRQKQFSPVCRSEDFVVGRFAGLQLEDFYIAVRGERIVGTVAVWDQAQVRQTYVERYSGALRWLRPAYNALAALGQFHPLPREGERIPYVYIGCIAVEESDVDVFRDLLQAVMHGLRGGRWRYAIAGLHETDPLAAVLQEFQRIETAGRLYVVHYPEESLSIEGPERRVPYVEAGCL